MITVKVGRVPGQIRDIALNDCSTVNAALSAASLTSSGYQITVNGVAADGSKVLNEGDKVLLTKNIKGNF